MASATETMVGEDIKYYEFPCSNLILSSYIFCQTDEKTFQFEWIISFREFARPNVDDILKQKFTFETLLFPNVNLNWELGFSTKEIETENIIFYQKLIKLPNSLKNLATEMKIGFMNNLGDASISKMVKYLRY